MRLYLRLQKQSRGSLPFLSYDLPGEKSPGQGKGIGGNLRIPTVARIELTLPCIVS